jgi:hypothetical protein
VSSGISAQFNVQKIKPAKNSGFFNGLTGAGDACFFSSLFFFFPS